MSVWRLVSPNEMSYTGPVGEANIGTTVLLHVLLETWQRRAGPRLILVIAQNKGILQIYWILNFSWKTLKTNYCGRPGKHIGRASEMGSSVQSSLLQRRGSFTGKGMLEKQYSRGLQQGEDKLCVIIHCYPHKKPESHSLKQKKAGSMCVFTSIQSDGETCCFKVCKDQTYK